MRIKILFICLFTGVFAFLNAEIPQSEKDALLAISESLHYPSNWTEDIPFEYWNGIIISELEGQEHVTSLSVGVTLNNSLGNVNFSSEIQDLTYLSYFQFIASGGFDDFDLNFDFQNLAGLDSLEEIYIRFPGTDGSHSYYLLNTNQIVEIDNLKNLTIMFDNPDFMMPDNFSDSDQLEYLKYENTYNYFPNYIYNLQNLKELIVRVKVESYFPDYVDNLSNLSNLKTFTFIEAPFSNFNGNLPDVFYNLPSIENLTLSFYANNLVISDNISNYTNQLKSLSISNSYSQISSNLWNLNLLENLSISSQIAIPDEIQNLSNLKILYIYSSSYLNIPPTIKNLSNLESLSLISNYYSEYPEDIYETPNLKTFVTTVFEEIPELISTFPNVQHVQVYSVDGLLGTLPEFFGSMTNLKKLDILNDYDGDLNDHLFTLPENYFNWPDLEQFWTVLKIDSDVTNKFLSSPNLKVLAFENFGTQNLRGFLNLCNNPKLEALSIYNSDIHKIDVRNNETFTNGDLRFFRFNNNSITNFYVDDVDVFNNLIATNKIRITNNIGQYQVSTSTEECERTMAVKENVKEENSIYPNPTKDFIYFEKGKQISDVTVTSIDGKTFEVFPSNGKVNVSYLPRGVYIIKYRADGIYYLNKFVKN